MAEFGSLENILWFWAVLFITVPPVLRFRENFLVPLLSTLLVFGFYTQSYWMPDFYSAQDWPKILGICAVILAFYYVCGFFVHYAVFRMRSENLREYGAFGPLLSAWISGKAYVITDKFVAEIRRFRMFEVAWPDVRVDIEADGTLVLTDGQEREPEILSAVRVKKSCTNYSIVRHKLESKDLM